MMRQHATHNYRDIEFRYPANISAKEASLQVGTSSSIDSGVMRRFFFEIVKRMSLMSNSNYCIRRRSSNLVGPTCKSFRRYQANNGTRMRETNTTVTRTYSRRTQLPIQCTWSLSKTMLISFCCPCRQGKVDHRNCHLFFVFSFLSSLLSHCVLYHQSPTTSIICTHSRSLAFSVFLASFPFCFLLSSLVIVHLPLFPQVLLISA